MKKSFRLATVMVVSMLFPISYTLAQTTCTISGSGTILWDNASPPSCVEGGDADDHDFLVIPNGVEIDFDTSGDTWAGTSLTVENGGVVTISFNGQITLDANVVVEGGGYIDIQTKLNLGASGGGCNYNLIIEDATGNVNVGDGASDRLNICGVEIVRGGPGGCSPYPTAIPYCEPTGGLIGPAGFDDSGLNNALPVTIVDFDGKQSGKTVKLTWLTSSEENFSHFVVERSTDGSSYEATGSVKGQGKNLLNVETLYTFTDAHPLLGWNYYRLKSIDIDNSFEYSEVTGVKVDAPKSFTVFPNPSDGSQLTFESNFRPSEFDRIVVTDQFGAELTNLSAVAPLTTFSFDEKLPGGIYFVRYIGKYFQSTARVIVSK